MNNDPGALASMTEDDLVALHALVHAELRRRFPAGDFPLAEVQERRAELRRDARRAAPAAPRVTHIQQQGTESNLCGSTDSAAFVWPFEYVDANCPACLALVTDAMRAEGDNPAPGPTKSPERGEE